MTRAQRFFLDLVQPFPLQSPLELTVEELMEIKALAWRHKVLMLVYSRFKGHAAEFGADNNLREFLKSNESYYLSNIALSARQDETEKQVGELLQSEGIPSVVFKGNMLARDVYGDMFCRTSSDVDILIKPGDAVAVDRLLLHRGFTLEGEAPLEFSLLRIHHVGYRTPQRNDLVEMHWHFAVPYFFKLSAAEIWDEVIVMNGKLALTREMILIMLFLHHHSHSFRQLKVLIDVLWALYKYRDRVDQSSLLLRLKEIGLANTAFISSRQIVTLWDKAADELPFLVTLQDNVPGVDSIRRRCLDHYFRIDPDGDTGFLSSTDKLVKRLSLDKWNMVFQSYAKGLFPPTQAIRRYGGGNNLPASYGKYLGAIIRSWLR